MIWKADCFPVSTRKENKSDYPYIGNGSKINGTKKKKKNAGRAKQEIGSMDNNNVGPRSSEKMGAGGELW